MTVTLERTDTVGELIANLFSKAVQLDVTADELSEMGAFDDYIMDRNRFETLEQVLLREREQRMHRRTRMHFQHRVRRKLIQDWLGAQATVTKRDGERIAETVSLYTQNERERDLAEFLRDVESLGYHQAEKNRKKRNRAASYLACGFVGMIGLIRLVVLFLVFNAATTKFESIVLALLAMAVITISGGSTNIEYHTSVIALPTLRNLFKKTLHSLSADETEWERENRLDEEDSARQGSARSRTLILTESGFSMLAWIYAFATLILAAI